MPPTQASPKSTRKASARARKAASSRRRRESLPILPLAIGGVFVVVFVALIIAYHVATSQASGQAQGQTVANIECQTNEQVAVHYHAHLTLLYRGVPTTVPMGIGIPGGQQDPNSTTPYVSTGNCFYWLHTHDDSGVIHVEAPRSDASRVFTLGDFFQVWGQPISSNQIATLKVDPSNQLKMWVNGKPYTGNPAAIPLTAHGQIVMEIGAPFQQPPPSYTFPSGL